MNKQELCQYLYIRLKNIYNELEINYITKFFVSYWHKSNHSDKLDLQSFDDYPWIDHWLASLKMGMPIEYVAGEAVFMELELIIGEGVLIPRPETEELCSLIQNELKFKTNLNVLDIGSGSGCISVYLKKWNPSWNLYALDISERALEYTLKNAQKHKVLIEFIQMDFLKESKNIDTPFDVIISNPPYISRTEENLISKQTLDFEPHMALFPDSEDKLIFYKHILEFAKSRLNSKGFVFLELNATNADQVYNLFFDTGLFNTELGSDLFSKPRFLKAQLKE